MSQRVPVLIYDGDCGFCRRWVARWRRRTGPRVRYLPYQGLGVRLRFGVRKRDARRAAQLVEPDGRRTAGAAAMLGALRYARAPWPRILAGLGLLPGVRSVTALTYRFIAAHRTGASRVQRRLEQLIGRRGRGRDGCRGTSPRPGLALPGLAVTLIVASAFVFWRARPIRRFRVP